MAGDLNKVIIEGRLVANAELSRWNDGTPYCKFTIANNDSYKDSQGNWISIGSFFDCTLSGAYGETMYKHLIKGRGVHIVGRLKQSKWSGEDGSKHSRIYIKVEEVHLNYTGGNFEQNQQPAQQQPQCQQVTPQQQEEQYIPFGSDDNVNEEIPF